VEGQNNENNVTSCDFYDRAERDRNSEEMDVKREYRELKIHY
jgi:hypothetical protein